jgi:hypothetical protein
MAKKKTAKKEAPVTADEMPVEEYDATRYTPWTPGNMPVGGKSNSTEQLNDHPTEHNHSAEAISDIVDRFADLRLYVPASNSCGVDGDFKVDGNSDLKINVPADAWGAGSGTVFTPQGMVGGTQGAFATAMTCNGYRNTSDGWTSLRLNGEVGAATLELHPNGSFHVRTAGTMSASDKFPPFRFSVINGLTKAYGDLQVDGQTKAQNGTRSAPAYSFASETKTGMYRPESNALEVMVGGERAVYFGKSTNSSHGVYMPLLNARPAPPAAYPAVMVLDNSEGGMMVRATSARRHLKNIEAVNLDATNSVYDLKPVWYRSKTNVAPDGHSHYGFVADDVAAIDPRLVTYSTDDEGQKRPETVNDHAVIALLVSAVQEQRATISDLNARVEALENA